LLPGWQYNAAQVSNDTLAWLAGALAIYIMVRTLRAERVGLGLASAIGATIGLCLLTKATAWAVAAVLVAAVIWRHRGRLTAPAWAVMVLAPIVIAGWWFVRNEAAFGRPLPPFTPVTANPQHLRSAHEVASWVSLVWKRTVGVEGAHESPIVVGPGRATLALLSLAGVLLALAFAVIVAQSWRSWDRQRRVLAVWLAAPALVLIGLALANSVSIDNQPQARYLLVAAPSWGCAAAWFIARVGSGWSPRVFVGAVSLLVCSALVLDVASLHTLRAATA
jgi:hypothetical protein